MITSLDSRYESKLSELRPFLGDCAFVYYMYLWSVSYAQTFDDSAINHSEVSNLSPTELYSMVRTKESITNHQMTALLQVLAELYPNSRFHSCLTSEDIMHNSRVLQQNLIMAKTKNLMCELSNRLDMLSAPIGFPILEHTHGQPATPVELGPFLKAKIADIKLIRPNYRFGGSNGQLSVFKKFHSELSVEETAQKWIRKMNAYLSEFYQIAESDIVFPMGDKALLQVGPHNDGCYFSLISASLKLRALCRTFWTHASRGILSASKKKGETGSSAMPHKNNPILFENAEGCFTLAAGVFNYTMEANIDTRNLRDLSNSVINRQTTDGFCYFYLGVSGLISGMKEFSYDGSKCFEELRRHPECLSEFLRYYTIQKTGKDPYVEMRNNPPECFDDAIKTMADWEFLWPTTPNPLSGHATQN
jgi:adenylosuccinate lyase